MDEIGSVALRERHDDCVDGGVVVAGLDEIVRANDESDVGFFGPFDVVGGGSSHDCEDFSRIEGVFEQFCVDNEVSEDFDVGASSRQEQNFVALVNVKQIEDCLHNQPVSAGVGHVQGKGGHHADFSVSSDDGWEFAVGQNPVDVHGLRSQRDFGNVLVPERARSDEPIESVMEMVFALGVADMPTTYLAGHLGMNWLFCLAAMEWASSMMTNPTDLRKMTGILLSMDAVADVVMMTSLVHGLYFGLRRLDLTTLSHSSEVASYFHAPWRMVRRIQGSDFESVRSIV